jgi:hypothetical protein
MGSTISCGAVISRVIHWSERKAVTVYSPSLGVHRDSRNSAEALKNDKPGGTTRSVSFYRPAMRLCSVKERTTLIESGLNA